MSRRRVLIVLLTIGIAVPAGAAEPPVAETPQDAVAVIKRVLNRSTKPCATDWARIDAVGFRGDWKIDVRIRTSKAGKGMARWRIGEGWPVATNALARALAHRCPAD